MIRLSLVVTIAAALFAQAAKFEVAAIKPSTEPMLNYMYVRPQPGGRLTATGPVHFLIQNAYGLQPFQVVGGPAWANSDRFDIDAKAEGNPTQKELVAMLGPLLEERFHLKSHRETRELPVYNLAIAKSGLKLTAPKNGNCSPVDSNPMVLPPPGTAPPCGRLVVRASPTGVTLLGGQVSISEFERVLSNVMGRKVLDRTGLSGTYDIQVTFTPDSLAAGLPSGVPPPPTGDAAPPSIVTAMQEQAGLKLESAKAPLEVLVVDHVERPTAN